MPHPKPACLFRVQGAKAYDAGLKVHDCPHPETAQAWGARQEWVEGYIRAALEDALGSETRESILRG